jgi:hypothetical protein
VKLLVLLAKQTLDSARHGFGDDFADDPMVFLSITRARPKARFLTAKIERIPEAANIPIQSDRLSMRRRTVQTRRISRVDVRESANDPDRATAWDPLNPSI